MLSLRFASVWIVKQVFMIASLPSLVLADPSHTHTHTHTHTHAHTECLLQGLLLQLLPPLLLPLPLLLHKSTTHFTVN